MVGACGMVPWARGARGLRVDRARRGARAAPRRNIAHFGMGGEWKSRPGAAAGPAVEGLRGIGGWMRKGYVVLGPYGTGMRLRARATGCRAG